MIFCAERPDAVLVGLDPFCNSRRVQLVHLATRFGVQRHIPPVTLRKPVD